MYAIIWKTTDEEYHPISNPDGDRFQVVYFKIDPIEGHIWVRDLSEATLFDTREKAEELRRSIRWIGPSKLDETQVVHA